MMKMSEETSRKNLKKTTKSSKEAVGGSLHGFLRLLVCMTLVVGVDARSSGLVGFSTARDLDAIKPWPCGPPGSVPNPFDAAMAMGAYNESVQEVSSQWAWSNGPCLHVIESLSGLPTKDFCSSVFLFSSSMVGLPTCFERLAQQRPVVNSSALNFGESFLCAVDGFFRNPHSGPKLVASALACGLLWTFYFWQLWALKKKRKLSSRCKRKPKPPVPQSAEFSATDSFFPRFDRVLCYECRKLGGGKKRVQRAKGSRTRCRDRAWAYRVRRQAWWLQGRHVSATEAELFAQSPRANSGVTRCMVKLAPRIAPTSETSSVEPLAPQGHGLSRPRRRRRPSWAVLILVALAFVGGARDLSEAAWINRESTWCFKDRGHNSMLGCRIGEASHPGPAGSARTARVRAEAQESSPDTQLAQTLFSVLQAFQASRASSGASAEPKGDKPKGGKSKGSGKGKTVSTQVDPSPSLASRLMQMLHAAVQNQWTDDKVAEHLLLKLKPWVEDETPQPRTPRNVSLPTRPTEETTSRTLRAQPQQGSQATLAKGKGKGPKDGSGRDVSVSKGKGKGDTSPPGPPLNKSSGGTKGGSKGKGGGAQTPVAQPKPNRFATRILQSEWDEEVSLTTVPQLRKALEAGEGLPGNLIICRAEQVIEEVRELLNAFAPEGGLTVAVVSQSNSLSPSAAVWWGQDRTNLRPERCKLVLTQLGNAPGPDFRPPNTVTIQAESKTKLVSIKISAPSSYRSLFVQEASKDDPSKVIAELAKAVGCRCCVLTGGGWHRQTHKQGCTLTGHLRVPQSLADKLVQCSAKRGLFVSVQSPGTPKLPVAWLPKDKGMSSEDYLLYVQAEATRRKLPIALRQGGGNDLGLIGADQLEYSAPRAGTWCLFDTPKSWLQEDIQDFMKETGWRQIQIITRRRGSKKSGGHVWVVRALEPEGFQGQASFCYSDVDCCITIAAEVSRPRQQIKSQEKVAAPRKKWSETVTDWAEDVPSTQLDAEEEEQEENPVILSVQTATPKNSARRPRSRSRERKDKGPATQDPDKQLLEQCPEWTLVDSGGAGDCGFRAIAQCIAQSSGKALDDKQVATEASRLRLLAVGHLQKHAATFEPSWAQDPEERPEHRGGQPEPESFRQYTTLASRKDVWFDGMLGQALAARLGTPIIIWSFCNATVLETHGFGTLV